MSKPDPFAPRQEVSPRPTGEDFVAHQIRGLGDVIHKLANPIATGLDHLLGTHLADCTACDQRRATLNKLLPLGQASAAPPPGPRRPSDPS